MAGLPGRQLGHVFFRRLLHRSVSFSRILPLAASDISDAVYSAGIPLYVLPIIIWKLWKKSKWVKLTEMDLFSGRMEAEDEEYEKVPNTWYEKLWAWMF